MLSIPGSSAEGGMKGWAGTTSGDIAGGISGPAGTTGTEGAIADIRFFARVLRPTLRRDGDFMETTFFKRFFIHTSYC
jgi:hypothetical protein